MVFALFPTIAYTAPLQAKALLPALMQKLSTIYQTGIAAINIINFPSDNKFGKKINSSGRQAFLLSFIEVLKNSCNINFSAQVISVESHPFTSRFNSNNKILRLITRIEPARHCSEFKQAEFRVGIGFFSIRVFKFTLPIPFFQCHICYDFHVSNK